MPIGAAPIGLEWTIQEGGICAYAWTDSEGVPYLAVKTLHRNGHVTGLPDWIRTDWFENDMVAGFTGKKPIIVNVQVAVTKEGLVLIVGLPSELRTETSFLERLFTKWGSEGARFSFLLPPNFIPRAVNSFTDKQF